MSHETLDPSLAQLAGSIREWGRELGFQQVGIADVEVAADEQGLMRWLDEGRHEARVVARARHGARDGSNREAKA